MMKISLVLATVHRTDDVGRFINAIAAQSARNYELIVVDQNPDGRLEPFIERGRRLGVEIMHLRLDRPSLSGARNLGISRATGDVIAFPDDDCWYESEVIERVTEAFVSHPGWSALTANWVEQTAARSVPFPSEPLSNEAWRQFRGGDASSISLFIRTELFTRLGGFDERLGVGQWFGAGEEIDFVFRALASGAIIGRCPSARLHHEFDLQRSEGSTADWRALQRRARGTGALYVKHRLPPLVILRGLVAPPVRAALRWRGGNALKCAMATSIGRIQGAVRWIFSER